MAFDVIAAIPAGAVIQSVELKLFLFQTASAAGPKAVELRRALADWGEGGSDAGDRGGPGATARAGDATWVHRFLDAAAWSQAGGDYSGTASASRVVDADGLFYSWGSTPQLVADVQGWVDGASGNFGWLLLGDESAGQTAKQFASREYAVPANRPALTIQYSVPEPGALGLAAWTMGVLLVRRGRGGPPDARAARRAGARQSGSAQ